MLDPLRVRKYFPPFLIVLAHESLSRISQKPAFSNRCLADSTTWKAIGLS